MTGIHFWPNGLRVIPAVSGEFGPRKSPGGVGSTNHQGMDFQRGIIYNRASADGVVTYAGYSGGFGNLVVIEHTDGTETKYGHGAPGSFRVKKGDRVKRGQILSTTGTTGNSTGVHLHWECRNGPGRGAINPRIFMRDNLAPIITGWAGQGSLIDIPKRKRTYEENTMYIQNGNNPGQVVALDSARGEYRTMTETEVTIIRELERVNEEKLISVISEPAWTDMLGPLQGVAANRSQANSLTWTAAYGKGSDRDSPLGLLRKAAQSTP